MSKYLVQVAYTPEAWGAMVQHPQDRKELVEPAVQALGGKIEEFYFAFGDYDVVAIIDMPETTDAAAFSLAATAGGACKALKTTPLMTVEEGMEAMRKAAKSGYRPPG